jgi:uracil-DNA glycosylase
MFRLTLDDLVDDLESPSIQDVQVDQIKPVKPVKSVKPTEPINTIDTITSHLDTDWLELFAPYTTTLQQITRQILGDNDDTLVTPKPSLWLECFRRTSLESVRVIIVGMDPYHDGSAHGLAFSCLAHRRPPSLNNIFKCLVHHELMRPPTTNDLTPWANQGVLLLNAALSTKPGVAGAHPYWHRWTSSVLRAITHHHRNRPLYVLLWGNNAKKLAPFLHKNTQILVGVHPSSLNGNKFLECDHFSQLQALKPPIRWELCRIPIDARTRLCMDDQGVVAFTDGSALLGKSAGYAVCFQGLSFDDITLYGKCVGKLTNIVAEGMAILATLRYLTEHPQWQHAVIISDSELWIKMINVYMPRWERDGIDFATKANSNLSTEIHELWKDLRTQKRIELRHVRAHNKSGWEKYAEGSYERWCYINNDYVDQLAGYARVQLAEYVVDVADY